MKDNPRNLRLKTDIEPEQIYETEAFKGLSKIRQRIFKSWNNIKAIDNNLKAARELGLDQWLKKTMANDINREVVVELLIKQKEG